MQLLWDCRDLLLLRSTYIPKMLAVQKIFPFGMTTSYWYACYMLLSGISNLYGTRHKCFPSWKSNFTAKSNVADGSFVADLALIMQKNWS